MTLTLMADGESEIAVPVKKAGAWSEKSGTKESFGSFSFWILVLTAMMMML